MHIQRGVQMERMGRLQSGVVPVQLLDKNEITGRPWQAVGNVMPFPCTK